MVDYSILTDKEHKAIWFKIARSFGTPAAMRSKKELKNTRLGLCRAFNEVAINRLGPLNIIERLKFFSGNGGYWFPTYGYNEIRKYDTNRCLIACMFAAMNVEEFVQLTEPQRDTEIEEQWASLRL